LNLTTFPGLYGRDFFPSVSTMPGTGDTLRCTESGCRAFFQDAFMTILSQENPVIRKRLI
ncbi:hypothetical protein WKQ39_004728, partial [Escherichia coli]